MGHAIEASEAEKKGEIFVLKSDPQIRVDALQVV